MNAINPLGAAKVCGGGAYRPDQKALGHLLQAVRPQLSDLVIVHNGVGCDFADLLPQGPCDIIELHDNYGIARAQSIGIEYARKQEADYVLLLDQDSSPAALRLAVGRHRKAVRLAGVAAMNEIAIRPLIQIVAL